MRRRVIIIGAGMAGLAAAGVLREAGIDPVLVDKGRAVGGRMASRRIGGARFDHGAQHFSARSAEFRAALDEWTRAGVVRTWFSAASHTRPDQAVEPRYVPVGGMRALPEHLAAPFDVHTATHVSDLAIDDGAVTAVAGGTPVADGAGVIVTAPIPQTLELLDRSRLPLPDETRRTLDSVVYNPCLAVMAILEDPPDLPDGHLALAHGPVAWIADNQHKGVSPIPAVTIHSTPAAALGHLEVDVQVWTNLLVGVAQVHLRAPVISATGHRWRYAMPKAGLDGGYRTAATPVPLLVAGEAFAGARVEGAYLSGLAAGRAMAERIA